MGAWLPGLLIGAAHAVELLAHGRKGTAKQDAALSAVAAMIRAVNIGGGAEVIPDRDVAAAMRELVAHGGSVELLHRPAVAVAMRDFLNSYVALQNVIAREIVIPENGRA